MKFLFLVSFCLATFGALSQQVVDVSKTDYRVGTSTFFAAGGEPFVSVKFVNLAEGTPYFRDDWANGTLVSREGQEYKNISVRLDLFYNQLHYLDPDGKEFISTTPLRELLLYTPKDTLHFIYSTCLYTNASGMFICGTNSLPPVPGWYLLLASGKVPLYTFYRKTVQENKPYGAAAVQQTIKTDNVFVVQTSEGFIEVHKLKDLPDVLSDKKAELEEFLKTHDNRKATSEQRFTAAVNYYNSLNKQ